MKVGFVQFCPFFGNKRKNLKKIAQLIEDVEADLLVLPELCTTGYIFKNKEELRSLAESIPDGPTVDFFKDLANEKGINLVWGMPERDYDKVFNTSVLVTSEGEIENYRKVHLYDQEKFLFTPGDRELDVVEIKGAVLGMMICFDWIFPEACRVLALKDAEIICHPSNLVLQYCQPAMITRCIENRVFSITANRYGTEQRNQRKLTFTGKSQIVSPQGEILALASSDTDEVKVVEIKPELAKDKMATPNNHLLKDRRIDFYKKICKNIREGQC
ncbi:MAG: nitrilase-related carbon-nitrogen hydrolase [Candidatus Zixiibacteriota bacterium]